MCTADEHARRVKRTRMRTTVAQLIAHAVHDAGARVVTHVPGFGGTQVFDAWCAMTATSTLPSFHEEVAYTIAHGASLVGQRAATLIKAHGLVKAANSVIDSLSAGTTAGFVILVFDDPRGQHSDNIFDVPAFLRGLGILFHVPQPRNMYAAVIEAFRQSEAVQLPIVLLMDVDTLDQPGTYRPLGVNDALPRYYRDVPQHVVCPLFAEYQRQVVTAKLSGRNWREVPRPVVPTVPDDLPPAWQATARVYLPFFQVFQTIRGEVITGDTSISTLFALPPYHSIDMGTYMGGSLPLAMGAYLAGYHHVWALTGDFSFIAAGQLGLVEAIQRAIPLKVVIFHNGTAQATGGQPIPPHMLDRVLQGYASSIRYIRNPQDGGELTTVLDEASHVQELRIIVAEYHQGADKPTI
jgi:TPP-dependent indolepyruvate ferredoxin oxidoreductase alpha subunit